MKLFDLKPTVPILYGKNKRIILNKTKPLLCFSVCTPAHQDFRFIKTWIEPLVAQKTTAVDCRLSTVEAKPKSRFTGVNQGTTTIPIRKRKFIFLLVFIHLFLCQLTFAQSPELGQLYLKKNEFVKNKDYKNALVWGEKMLALAAKELGTDVALYANYANDMGQLYMYHKQYGKARKLFAQTCSIYKTKLGESHLYYGVALNSLGNVYYEEKKHKEALPHYQTALGIYETKLGKQHQYYLMLSKRIFDAKVASGTSQEAEALRLNRLAEIKKTLGASHDNYAFELVEVAGFYKGIKQYKKAVVYYEQGIQVYRANKSNENLAVVLNNLALTYEDMKLYAKEKRALNESLDIFKHKLNDTKSAGYAQTLSNMLQFRMRQKGKDKKIEALFLEVLPLLKANGLTLRYLRHAYNLASDYQEKFEFDKAEKWYKEVIETTDKTDIVDEVYVNAMNNLAVIYSDHGHYLKAETLIKEGLVTHEKQFGKNKRTYAMLLTGLGDLYRIAAKHTNAEKTFLEAEALIVKLMGEKSLEYANILNSLGYLYKVMGEYDKAEKRLLGSLEVYKQTTEVKDEAYGVVLNNLGLLYTAKGLYEKAEEVFLRCLKVQAKAVGKTHYEYGTTLNNLGLLYFDMGVYSKAMPRYFQALKIKKDNYGKWHPHYANTLLNIALIGLNTGNYNEAEQKLLESLDIYETTLGKKHLFYANCLQNLAWLNSIAGRYKKASAMYTEAGKIMYDLLGENHVAYATFQEQVGKHYFNLQNYQKAGDLFYAALNTREKKLGKTHPEYFQALLNLRTAYMAMDKVAMVDKHFEGIIPLAEKALAKNPVMLAAILRNKSADYQRKKQYKKAETLMLKSLRMLEKVLGKNNQEYLHALINNAIFYTKTKQLSKAEKYYLLFADNFLEHIEKNYPAMSEKDKQSFQYASMQYIEAFKHFAIRQGSKSPKLLAKLFEFNLATKELTLNISKKMKEVVLASKDAASLNLYKQWVAQKEYMAKLYQLPKTTLKDRNIDLNILEEKNNVIEKKLAQKYKLFSQQIFQQKYTWNKVQKALKPNEVAIEIIRTVDFFSKMEVVYGAILIRSGAKTKPMLMELKDGTKLEQRYLRYYRNSIKFKRKDKYSYKLFWQPLQHAMDSLMQGGKVETIYFSPDGLYNQVNLKTLQNPRDKQYLFSRYKIHLVNGTKEVIAWKKSGNKSFVANTQAVLVGRPIYKLPENGVKSTPATKTGKQTEDRGFDSDRSQQQLALTKFSDLPGTEKEVEQIEQLMQNTGWKVNKMMGNDALEKNIKKIVNPAILHIATHGFFIPSVSPKRFGSLSFDLNVDYYAPMLRSGIVLTGVSNKKNVLGGEEDGILTAYEVTNLRLEKTKLVVLSACETGLGDFRMGEGVFGLQRALKIAGAKNIIMSLWKVDDQATQELMVGFYRNLIKLKDLRKAFRVAQQELKVKFPHPHYWGAFILLGE